MKRSKLITAWAVVDLMGNYSTDLSLRRSPAVEVIRKNKYLRDAKFRLVRLTGKVGKGRKRS